MPHILNRFIHDDSGATAIEYGLIAALIAVALVTAISALSTKLQATFGKVTAALP